MPRSLLVALFLALVFEAGNAVLDDRFYSPPFEGLRMKIKNRVALIGNDSFDVIVLGDSYCISGIMPAVIEKETGRSCFNFSTHGRQTILASYGMMRNYLRRCSRKPEYLVIGFLPQVCDDTRQKIEKEHLPYMYDLKEGNMTLLFAEFGWAQGIKFLIPSFKHQAFFKRLLARPFSTQLAARGEIEEFKRGVAADGGYYAWRPPKRRRNVPGADKTPYRFSASPFFREYLYAILDLAASDGIRVIYVMPTKRPDWYKIREKQGVVKEYREFAEEIKSKYPGITVLDPQAELDRKDFYVNRDHLNGKGARVLSGLLAERIDHGG